MILDKSQLPLKVWHISTERIRRGQGVQAIAIREIEFQHGDTQAFSVQGRKGRVWNTDCYLTEQEAKDEARRICRREQRWEADRYMAIRNRLAAVAKELG